MKLRLFGSVHSNMSQFGFDDKRVCELFDRFKSDIL